MMKSLNGIPHSQDTDRPGPSPCRSVSVLRTLLLLALLLLMAPATRAQDAPERSLVLSDVVLEGAQRTPRTTVLRHLELQPGQAIRQDTLLEAVRRLREDHLFAEVDFFTRPGAERGQLVLVLEVVEHTFNWRWGVGNSDIDGWYVSPLLFERRNFSGRGDLMRFEWREGFRTSGLFLRYQRPHDPDGRRFSEVSLAVLTTGRPYFDRGTEFRHNVYRKEIGFLHGRRLSRHSLIEASLTMGTVDSAERSVAETISPDGSITNGQEIPIPDQPAAIAAVHGVQGQAVLSLDWQRDTRGSRRRAGSPTSGTWSRLKGTLTLQEGHSHAGLQGDMRFYREIPGGVLAGRMQGSLVGRRAAFYDRLYLGGMFSVRGFSTHSLSAPEGDTWLTSASLEYRSRILGKGERTSLAGVLFLDAGLAGSDDTTDPYDKLAASVGYGVRIRIPWLDWLGVDVGFPLTERPLDMRFTATASIGWSF